jgi:AbrB family looped-hinge helix DNA binding protein
MIPSVAEDSFVVSIREKGRLTLPLAARERLRLDAGDTVFVFLGQGSLEIVPAGLVMRDQLWFYSSPIRRRIEEAEDDIACSRVLPLASPGSLSDAVNQLDDPVE